MLRGVTARGEKEPLICDPCTATVRKDMAAEFELRWRVRGLRSEALGFR
jgi:hypothetical protein